VSFNEPAKVLLVEDDLKLIFVLKAHLRNAGYEVREAHDGLAGVAAARDWRPDVVVMDISMPVLDGIAATQRLKADPDTAYIPVIILTANNKPEDVVLGLESGATEYVTKPFEIVEFMARVHTALKLAQAHRQLDALNARLADEVERKTKRLQILYHFTRALSAAETVDAVLDLIVEATRQATGSGRISILLRSEPRTSASGTVNDGSEYLTCARAYGIDPQVAEDIRIKSIDGIAGKVFTSGKTVVAQACARDRGLKDSRDQDELAHLDPYRGDVFLSTPLVSASLTTQEDTLGVINVTNKEDEVPFTEEEIECIRSIADAGAVALHNQMHRKRLKDAVKVLLLTVGRLAEYRDEETGSHLERVREYARILAESLAESHEYRRIITPAYIEDLYQAAPMHDIGKVGIPDEILNKTSSLTAEEFNIMKNHTEIGRRTLQLALKETGPVPLLQMCVEIAYGHHERFDGRGYPRGIAARNIPLAARIITLVDAYDAMTSRRCYKEPVAHEEAVERIRQGSGGHFDPDLVQAFMRRRSEFDATRRRLSDPEEHAQLVAAVP
jgi:response regulator RpfG family c-di-GMP phosphodiesterase